MLTHSNSNEVLYVGKNSEEYFKKVFEYISSEIVIEEKLEDNFGSWNERES